MLLVGVILIGLTMFYIGRSPKEEYVYEEKKVVQPVLYTLSTSQKPNLKFLSTHTYLEELQIILFFRTLHLKEKIARSEKVLDKHSFTDLIDELIDNNLVVYANLFYEVEIHERSIYEDGQNIIISDVGIENHIVDVANQTKKWVGAVILEYRHDKQTGNIYFSAEPLTSQ